MAKDVMAAWRDASWYPCAGKAEVFHVVVEKNGTLFPACNTTLMRHGYLSGHKGAILDESTMVPAKSVRNRCWRSGCRQKWPPPAAGKAGGTG